MRIIRAVVAATVAVVLTGTLGACSSQVPLKPAADANNPGCADVTVRLPDTVAGEKRRETNAQATGAWGSPASVLLYCGVPVPSLSTQRCIEVDGLYWLVNAENAPSYVLTNYGREPAVDVVVDTGATSATAALMSLARAVAATRSNGHECTDLSDADRIDSGEGFGTSS